MDAERFIVTTVANFILTFDRATDKIVAFGERKRWFLMFQNGAVFVVWPIVYVKFWSLELLFNEGSQESPETASVTGSFNGKN